MELQDREVSLKLKSRPLRCVYLVSDREELFDAIALYTHIWGGAANAILPVPKNSEELNSFKATLEFINPDYIFIPRLKLSLEITQILEKLPILIKNISKTEIQNHINVNSTDPIRLSNGYLSNISEILSKLYQNKLDKSNIRILNSNNTSNIEIALQTGLPTQSYSDYLIQNLSATTFYIPEEINLSLKAFLTLSQYFTPATLTLIGSRKSYNYFNTYLVETCDEETICLFLDDTHDLGIATAFWNCRWLYPYNKVFINREKFLENIRLYSRQIIEFMPWIRAINVTTPFSHEEALEMYNFLKSIFSELGKEILVKVNYQDFCFDWVPGTLLSSKIINTTRAITSENCVRFEPSIPVGHENTNFVFGYDAEVKFISGRKFFSPKTLANARLLNNQLWRLEYSESNKNNFGKSWLKQGLDVKASDKGITGLALAGQECFFFIHSDNIIITQEIKEIGFELKPNEHTRYAQGLVKRLGGIREIVSLINEGGADILSVLIADRTDQDGLSKDKIISALIRKRNFSQKDAQRIISEKLKPLLKSDLLRRGYCHKCQNCNLKTWLPLDEIRELIECKGCAEKEQLPLDDLEFTYKPNELAAQLVREGGLAVLMTAATLTKIPSLSSGFFQFGGDFVNSQNRTKFAEVDLFWLTEEALIIAECKSFFTKKEGDEETIHNEIKEKIERIKESLRRNLDVAQLIGASVVILGVLTNLSDISSLLKTISEMEETARSKKIDLHLILNGKIHLWGNLNGIDPRELRLDSLLSYEEISLSEWSIGESPSSYGGSVGSNGRFDKNILEQWESLEFRLNT
ncbi:hypothetical protein A4S05_28705 [Nostoc sp. KVJ20]|uniref:hypothetical protein n=1 Tax=Nostoc sp. KVJ20 TaxID=457944 RepID=UPI00083D0AA3|nr:hypothetical protein [Nostoc sp. KVJ20]ODH01494.1 hypothetical protein A4S05_28705 [Nostoc sp. KVJ20]